MSASRAAASPTPERHRPTIEPTRYAEDGAMLLAGLRRHHAFADAGTTIAEQWRAFEELGTIPGRRGTTRSGFLVQLLESERIREQVGRYVDRHGWDVAEDEEAWRRYQRRRMREDYADDEW